MIQASRCRSLREAGRSQHRRDANRILPTIRGSSDHGYSACSRYLSVAGSPLAHFERCIGLAWCLGCRIYTATMVHVPATGPSWTLWPLSLPTSKNSLCTAPASWSSTSSAGISVRYKSDFDMRTCETLSSVVSAARHAKMLAAVSRGCSTAPISNRLPADCGDQVQDGLPVLDGGVRDEGVGTEPFQSERSGLGTVWR